MKRLIFLTFLLFAVAFLWGVTEETASFKAFLYGNTNQTEYDNWMSHIAEGVAYPNYNLYANWDRQTRGFGAFKRPTNRDLNNWQAVVNQFLNDEYDLAQATLDTTGIPYQIVKFNDTDTGRIYYMLRELINMNHNDNNGTPDSYDDEHGAFTYGWGIFVINTNATHPIIVHVVHPADDFIAPPVACKAFLEWNAKALMINGAGREVAWDSTSTNPTYNNSLSASDPSRNSNHPFTRFYNQLATKLRVSMNHREFGVQLHSFDWNRHDGFNACQISPGKAGLYANLPIRDLSNSHLDMMNQTPYITLPANTVGTHDNVLVTDYYCVEYNTHSIPYVQDGLSENITNYMDLPGFNENRQMVKSRESWNDYDLFEPFFHIEMDELPRCYTQNMNNYRWFYAYNLQTNQWDLDHTYDNTLAYYQVWINAITPVLDDLFAPNDNQSPVAPTNLSIKNQSYSEITLEWTPASDHDFYSYEILKSTEPIANGNYTIFNKFNDQKLSAQAFNEIIVDSLQLAQNYYFAIRARDYHNNVSEISNEVSAFTGSAKITSFFTVGKDHNVYLKWTANSQIHNRGFSVLRANSENGIYSSVGDYTTHANLAGSTQSGLAYIFNDVSAENGNTYFYKIAAVDSSGNQYVQNYPTQACPYPIYRLEIRNNTNTIGDTLSFSMNQLAGDGFDNYYDIVKSGTQTSRPVYATFFESDYYPDTNKKLSQNTKGFYDPDQEIKSWLAQVACSVVQETLSVSLANYPRNGEKVYLIESSTNTYYDLTSDTLTYVVTSTGLKNFTLQWGNLVPRINFNYTANQYLLGGDVFNIGWSTAHNSLIDSLALYIKNDTDSIFISSGLPYNVVSFQWMAPPADTLLNARFGMRVYQKDGTTLDYFSAYTIGIFPTSFTYTHEAGNYLVSNPSVDYIDVVFSVWGANSALFSYSPSGYTNDMLFSHGVGYWLTLPAYNNYSSQAQIRRTAEDHLLVNAGWNIVPNLHINPYHIYDLSFTYNNNTYNYLEAIQYQLISSRGYTYDNGYVIMDEVKAMESFLMYSFVDNLTVKFSPYNQGENISLVPSNMYSTIKFFSPVGESDQITVGTNPQCGDGFDILFDLPEPLTKPFTPNIEVSLTKNPDFGVYTALNQEMRSPMSNILADTLSYLFTINQVGNATVNVVLDSSYSQIPEGYNVKVFLNNQTYDLTYGEQFTLPADLQYPATGMIIVENEYVHNSPEQPGFKNYLYSNYPNPFNPETNISFSLAKSAKVSLEIYNIKGQKVYSLADKQIYKAGNHNLLWHGDNSSHKKVASGIYFYRLSVDNKVINTKKMILIK